MATHRPDLLPVDGIVIERSKFNTLGLAFLALLAFPIGCLLVWGKIRDWIDGPGSRDSEVTLYGFLLGIALVPGSPIMVYTLIRSVWVRRRRLVIGRDRLQIVERHEGSDVVVVQIPFANIASAKYEVTATDRQVSIHLKDPNDPDSFDGDFGFELKRKSQGMDYCICEAFQDGAYGIAAKIEAAMDDWRERPTESPAETRFRRE